MTLNYFTLIAIAFISILLASCSETKNCDLLSVFRHSTNISLPSQIVLSDEIALNQAEVAYLHRLESEFGFRVVVRPVELSTQTKTNFNVVVETENVPLSDIYPNLHTDIFTGTSEFEKVSEKSDELFYILPWRNDVDIFLTYSDLASIQFDARKNYASKAISKETSVKTKYFAEPAAMGVTAAAFSYFPDHDLVSSGQCYFTASEGVNRIEVCLLYLTGHYSLGDNSFTDTSSVAAACLNEFLRKRNRDE